MSQWYYAGSEGQQGPVSTEQLMEWMRAGQMGPDVQVWRDGMAQWEPAGRVPALAGAFASAQPQAEQPAYAPAAGSMLAYESPGQSTLVVTPRAIEMLRQTKPWARLFSVLLFIGVGFIALASLINLIGVFGVASTGGRRAAGGVAVISLMGVVVMLLMAALYFVPALYLGRYASRINDLVRLRRQADFEAALEAQKSYWKFLGILTVVVLSLYALAFLVAIVGLGVATRRF